MSTSYYPLKSPLISLNVQEHKTSATLYLAGQGINGSVVGSREDVHKFISDVLVDWSNWVAHVYYGGKDVGPVVEVRDGSWSDDTWLMSEYGELTTLAAVKAGKRQKVN